MIEKDIDYYENLLERYELVVKQAQKAGADEESIRIIQKFKLVFIISQIIFNFLKII